MANDKDKKGSMTVAEAGRKGGQTVRDERGREFYEEIGKKGGVHDSFSSIPDNPF